MISSRGRCRLGLVCRFGADNIDDSPTNRNGIGVELDPAIIDICAAFLADKMAVM